MNAELAEPSKLFGRAAALLFWGVIAGVVALLVAGAPYYFLAAAERPFHALHSLLRPSGILGLTFAIVGLATMVASLFYLMRRSVAASPQKRRVRNWMRFHIMAGLLGPALVVVHAGIIPRSAVGGLAFLAMLVVVASGFLGRYVLSKVPKDLDGEELDVHEVRRRLGVYQQKLAQLGVSTAGLPEIGPEASQSGRLAWLILPLRGLLFGDPESRKLLRQMREDLDGSRELTVQAKSVLILARRLCQERQWMVRYRHLRGILGAWRFLHRWLVITMFAAVMFHIGIAIRYGGLWILGGHS